MLTMSIWRRTDDEWYVEWLKKLSIVPMILDNTRCDCSSNSSYYGINQGGGSLTCESCRSGFVRMRIIDLNKKGKIIYLRYDLPMDSVARQPLLRAVLQQSPVSRMLSFFSDVDCKNEPYILTISWVNYWWVVNWNDCFIKWSTTTIRWTQLHYMRPWNTIWSNSTTVRVSHHRKRSCFRCFQLHSMCCHYSADESSSRSYNRMLLYIKSSS